MAWFSQQAQVRPYNYRNAPSAAANSTMNFSENVATGPKEYPYNQQQFGHFIRGPKTGRIPQSPMSSTQVGQYSKPFYGFSGFATPMNNSRRNFYRNPNYNPSMARGEAFRGINNPMSWGTTPQARAAYIQNKVFNPNNYIMSNVKGGKTKRASKKHKKSKKSKTRKH